MKQRKNGRKPVSLLGRGGLFLFQFGLSLCREANGFLLFLILNYSLCDKDIVHSRSWLRSNGEPVGNALFVESVHLFGTTQIDVADNFLMQTPWVAALFGNNQAESGLFLFPSTGKLKAQHENG